MRHNLFNLCHVCRYLLVLVTCFLVMPMPANLWAQGNQPVAAPQDAQDKPAKEDQKEGQFKEPEEVTIQAKDRFTLSATWYQGRKGKEAAAIIMLHDLGRDRSDFHDLARWYSELGHCVIVPDLRGHGKSTIDPFGNEYQPDRLSKAQLLAIQADIEACKKFLIQKNDDEVCNIEFLMVVADGTICLPALGWCVVDWSFLPTTTKNGQDVKGLVMLNPDRTYRGVSVNEALRAPLISGKGAANPLDIMVVVGKGNRNKYRDGKGFYASVRNSRGKRDEEENWGTDDIFLREVNSSAQNKEFFERNPETVPEFPLDLLEYRILNNETYGWKKRKTEQD